jgi:Hypervirulence associated proteins TUDOR domain
VAEPTFKAGDKVEWSSSGGGSTGKVVKKLTSPMDIKGHHVAASKDNPEYLVETEEGKQAAHKPGSLKKA